eukprot:5608596-Prorocentrum_lima.AAC.1
MTEMYSQNVEEAASPPLQENKNQPTCVFLVRYCKKQESAYMAVPSPAPCAHRLKWAMSLLMVAME